MIGLFVCTGAMNSQQIKSGDSSVAPDAATNAKPPVCDLAGLNMKVVNVQAVSAITSFLGTLTTTAPDKRLVIVTMKGPNPDGAAEAPWFLIQDIQAVYATDNPNKKVDSLMQAGEAGYAVSAAVGFKVEDLAGGQSLWLFTKSQGNGLMQSKISGSEYTVAFELPKYVKNFSLIIPTAIKNAAGSVVQTVE
jgi:hypothetical protein